MKICPNCQWQNDDNAPVCLRCNFPFYQYQQPPQYQQPISQNIPVQQGFQQQQEPQIEQPKKKRFSWKIYAIIMTVLFLIALFTRGSSNDSKKASISDIPASELSNYCMSLLSGNVAELAAIAEPTKAPAAEAQPTGNLKLGDTATLGKFSVSVISIEKALNYENKDVLKVHYQFTNNSDDSKNFSFSISDTAFQNGIESEHAYDDDLNANENTDIRPGNTLEVIRSYKLIDQQTPVEIELKEFISFSNKKAIFEIPLP